jgi:hypothetical protein
MNPKRFAIFTAKVIAAHVTTYFLAGMVFYPWLTKPYYVGPNPVVAAFMRTEDQPELWGHAVRWFLPADVSGQRDLLQIGIGESSTCGESHRGGFGQAFEICQES